MQARLITRFKDITPDGAIIEWVVWRVPHPVTPSRHHYKYRAVFIVDGVRIIGFDNERGKGDHQHHNGDELAYEFRSVEQLVDDFIAAIEAWRTS